MSAVAYFSPEKRGRDYVTTSDIRDASGCLVARLIKSESLWAESGLSFWTSAEDFVQVGTWRHGEHAHLNGHVHNVFERSSFRTQEVVFVVSGSITAHLYSEEGVFIRDEAMEPGDLLICFAGGHGYTITSSDSRVLEIKNGPYYGADVDRRRLY